MSIYDKLAGLLVERQEDAWKVGFAELERLIGRKLPASAWKYPAWWSNDPSNNSMTKVWLRAGWRTEQVDVPAQTVVFRRVSADTAAAESGFGDRARALEFASARAPEIKMATKEMIAKTAETREGGGMQGGSGGGGLVAALLKEKGADALVSMEEFTVALPVDHPLADLVGFLEGTIRFAPGADPCAPAMTPEEWKEAEAEMEAEWEELYGPDSDFAKNRSQGKEGL